MSNRQQRVRGNKFHIHCHVCGKRIRVRYRTVVPTLQTCVAREADRRALHYHPPGSSAKASTRPVSTLLPSQVALYRRITIGRAAGNGDERTCVGAP